MKFLNRRLGRLPSLKQRSATLGVALATAVAMSSLVPSQGHALTFFVDGGTAATLPLSGFDPSGSVPGGIGPGSPVKVFTTANAALGGLKIDPTTDVKLRFTFIGKEASNTNYALEWIDNSTLLNNNQAPGTFVEKVFATLGPAPALIPFLFKTNGAATGNPDAVAQNGGPIDSTVYLAFSEIFEQIIEGVGYKSILAFFGDGAGDGDFDDMIVQITAISAVPIPPALLLFGSGLAGLGFLARRRKRKAVASGLAAQGELTPAA